MQWAERGVGERGGTLKFMNLDQLVAWVTESRLISDLKAALAEQGISANVYPNQV